MKKGYLLLIVLKNAFFVWYIEDEKRGTCMYVCLCSTKRKSGIIYLYNYLFFSRACYLDCNESTSELG